MRMSRARIKEFLYDWLGIKLAIGTINQCIHEMGRAVSQVEDQLIKEAKESNLPMRMRARGKNRAGRFGCG